MITTRLYAVSIASALINLLDDVFASPSGNCVTLTNASVSGSASLDKTGVQVPLSINHLTHKIIG